MVKETVSPRRELGLGGSHAASIASYLTRYLAGHQVAFFNGAPPRSIGHSAHSLIGLGFQDFDLSQVFGSWFQTVDFKLITRLYARICADVDRGQSGFGIGWQIHSIDILRPL